MLQTSEDRGVATVVEVPIDRDVCMAKPQESEKLYAVWSKFDEISEEGYQ